MDSAEDSNPNQRVIMERLKSVLREVRASEARGGAAPNAPAGVPPGTPADQAPGADGEAASAARDGVVGGGRAAGSSMTPERRSAIKHLLSHASPTMIAQAEQELVAEGFTIQDLTAACDVHLELFREAAGERRFDLPADHPISQFEVDHEVIFDALDELRAAAAATRNQPSLPAAVHETDQMRRCVDLLLAAENHNVRQENTLFPMLERYGIEQPPAIMWQEHNDMRDDKKRLSEALDAGLSPRDLADRVETLTVLLTEKFASHSRKERQILYPAALELFSAEDWRDIKEECDNLGYFTDKLERAEHKGDMR